MVVQAAMYQFIKLCTSDASDVSVCGGVGARNATVGVAV